MKLSRPAVSPVTLDVGRRWFKACQLQTAGGVRSVRRAARIPRARGGADVSPNEVRALMDTLERQGFAGREVALTLPSSLMLVSVMELPPKSSGAPLEQIGRAEMARAHKIDAGKLEMRWWELPGGVRATEGTHVMAVGCASENARALLDAFEGGGAVVTCLDTPITALGRAAAAAMHPRDRAVAVLELGWSSATLVMSTRESVLFERVLGDSGLAPVYARAGQSTGLDPEAVDTLVGTVGLNGPPRGQDHLADLSHEVRPLLRDWIGAMAGELRTSLAYSSRRYSETLSGLRVVGDGASIPGVVERIAAEVETKVSVMTPGEVAARGPFAGPAAESPGLIKALGTALQELGSARGERRAAA